MNKRKFVSIMALMVLSMSLMVSPVFAWQGSNQRYYFKYVSSATAVKSNVLLNHFYVDSGGSFYQYVSWIVIGDTSKQHFCEIGLIGFVYKYLGSYYFLECRAYVSWKDDGIWQRTDYYTGRSFGTNYALEVARGYNGDDDVWRAKIGLVIFDTYDFGETWSGNTVRAGFEWDGHPSHAHDEEQCSYIENMKYQYNEGSYYSVVTSQQTGAGTYYDHVGPNNSGADYWYVVDIP